MAKSIGLAANAASSRENAQRRPAQFLAAFTRRLASLVDYDGHKDVERYIKQRGGGVLNDGIEREISRHLGRL